ncbi:Rieske 2Fe-2S domain-containing protein [Pseudonocardia sp. RS010]|uniref:Rieske 2Fe-2S domain-containing protein n=1 Tax=Pseudonocardia sp. RS010 TaxID=3385979 RepID=UPI0039A0D03D
MADHPRTDGPVPTVTGAGSPWLTDRAGLRCTGPTTERHVDVLVLGGGITGWRRRSCSKARGARVAVVEAERVASGATGNNTAKVTALQAAMLHAVCVRCTHLGCLVRFNGAERSWDCPCHGSRSAVDGAVLEGPAVRPLERRPVPGPRGTGGGRA